MEGLAVPSKFYNILASGRPTIMVGDPKSEVARVILETECGFHVEQGDSARLAALLRELAATPDKLDQLSENAHRVCLQEYSMEKIGKQFYTALTAAALPINRTRRITSRSRRRSEGEKGSAEVGISEN
jgi:glycosyltransferase involved in cell wall biosynthesis